MILSHHTQFQVESSEPLAPCEALMDCILCGSEESLSSYSKHVVKCFSKVCAALSWHVDVCHTCPVILRLSATGACTHSRQPRSQAAPSLPSATNPWDRQRLDQIRMHSVNVECQFFHLNALITRASDRSAATCIHCVSSTTQTSGIK